MAALQPRSLLFLMLMGYACLAVPLGLGLHKASGVATTLGGDAERLLHTGVETARRARAVVALASDMQRNAQQFNVLRDPALIAIYDQRHRRLGDELARLGQSGDRELSAQLAAVHKLADALHRRLVDAQHEEHGLDASLPQFASLVDLARGIEQIRARRFDAQLASLGDNAQGARNVLYTQALVLVPVSMALAVVFSTLVMRPVRQLATAIRALGEGRLRERVVIQGPAEIATLGHEIEWLRARLAASDEEKNGFLRRMSHELKTPLASLREGTNLLRDGSVGTLDAAQLEVVDIMRESTQRLDAQIHNLLAFSALDSSRTSRRSERVQIDSLLTQVLRAYRLEVERRRLHIDVRLEPVAIMFDPEHLRMAIDNVVGNAVKFTPDDGRIGVALSAQRDRAVLDVIDSGPGIAQEERELIFKPFYQGSAAHQTHRQGTGVGLSVVRECLAAHGATVQVVPSSAGGAHLRLTFKGVRRAR